MDDTKWVRWLRKVTREESARAIARSVGVSHTTVQRWISKGMPAEIVWELTLKFNADPVEALILLERIAPDQTGALNYTAIVKYAPEHALTAELHRRAIERHASRSVRKSDILERQSMRLTAK